MDDNFMQNLAAHDISALSDFPLKLDGKDALFVGFTVTLYFKAPYDDGLDERLCQCMSEYLALAPDEPTLAGPPNASQWVRVGKRKLASPWETVSKLKPNREWDYAYAWTATDAEASPWNLAVLRGSPTETWALSYLHVTFPLTWAGNPKLVEVVRVWSERLNVYHGYVGASLLLPPEEIKQAELDFIVLAASNRFPGLNVDYPVSHSGCLMGGIKTVDWLTVLGTPFVEKLGGVEAVKLQLGSEYGVTSLLGGGLLIQAGATPQLGDSTKQERPRLYVALNQVLKAVRIADYPQSFQSGQFHKTYMNRMVSNAWIARFD